MNKILAPFLFLTLVSCGPSPQEKEEIAIITCNVLEASRNMDASFRIKEVNHAREKLGEEAYLGKDIDILHAIKFNFCKELVLNKGLDEKRLEIIFAEERRKEEFKIKKQKEELRKQELKDKLLNNIVFKKNHNTNIDECFIKSHYPNQICKGNILDLDNSGNFYIKKESYEPKLFDIEGNERTKELLYERGAEVPYTGLATKSQDVVDTNRAWKKIINGEKIQYFNGKEYVTEDHINPIEANESIGVKTRMISCPLAFSENEKCPYLMVKNEKLILYLYYEYLNENGEVIKREFTIARWQKDDVLLNKKTKGSSIDTIEFLDSGYCNSTECRFDFYSDAGGERTIKIN